MGVPDEMVNKIVDCRDLPDDRLRCCSEHGRPPRMSRLAAGNSRMAIHPKSNAAEPQRKGPYRSRASLGWKPPRQDGEDGISVAQRTRGSDLVTVICHSHGRRSTVAAARSPRCGLIVFEVPCSERTPSERLPC